ncbi:Haloacid dehalogenase-like hydrolase [Plectosphaerella cucumerina]|uniref:Haloacid dehalogenase-like hydrolase n=1 Tax=Plectosphaerella cucumerina TaxID=40658 RepID=A0A8K0X151_9PEZI|nr:Haloacid dehalogenase-like hydrolase [Plectosphaerella cucumerina]
MATAIAETRPAFLIRDPIRVLDSWKQAGRPDAQETISSYASILSTMDQMPSPAVVCVYEKFATQPQEELERLCASWGVSCPKTASKKSGLSTIPDVPPYHLLSNSEKDLVEERLGRLYLRHWQDETSHLRRVLSEKTWIGFDLDDTLHEFRRASSKATAQVLAKISERHGTPLPALKEEYGRVLRAGTANAFSDGKTSFDYRRERFNAVLERFVQPLPQDEHHFVTELLESYESTLMTSLETKCGAIGLLSAIKDLGKKVIIVTEGPQDAQERTIEALGIASYVDFLATTNRFQVAKTDGLFGKVLQHLNISPADMAYIGDSEQRDMEPAMAEGIFCIHLAEAEHVSLDTNPPRVNTLRKLQYILDG